MLSDKSFKKVVRSPSSVLNDLLLKFSKFDKINTLSSFSHPWIYNFFSYRDVLFFIAKSHSGKYSFRGYVPDSFDMPYPVVHRANYDIYFESFRYLDCVDAFSSSVRHALNFYDCTSSEFPDVLFQSSSAQ